MLLKAISFSVFPGEMCSARVCMCVCVAFRRHTHSTAVDVVFVASVPPIRWETFLLPKDANSKTRLEPRLLAVCQSNFRFLLQNDDSLHYNTYIDRCSVRIHWHRHRHSDSLYKNVIYINVKIWIHVWLVGDGTGWIYARRANELRGIDWNHFLALSMWWLAIMDKCIPVAVGYSVLAALSHMWYDLQLLAMATNSCTHRCWLV